MALAAGLTLSAAAQTAAPSAPPDKGRLENVIIVYKTHFDIGYSSTVHDVVHEYRTEMADRVLEAIEKNSRQPKEKQFVWTLSGWPMKQILWPGQTPERREKIEQAIRSGNLAIHAYPFTTHTETAEIEDLVRGLNISSTLARRYGRPLSVSAKMSDVPGHSWFLPTLFTRAGIRFYHMGGPLVNMTLGLPPMFWWEGPDGSRLLTLYNNGYGSGDLPPDGWPYKSWVSIRMTGDNEGPPAPETVSRDLAFYARAGVKAKVGTMDDFAGLILEEDLSKLPVVRSDISDTWIHGLLSQPEAARAARTIRPWIGGVEGLTTLEKIWGVFLPDFGAAVSAAYEKSLLYSEHTWGLANQHYIKLPFGRDWEDLWERGLPPQFKMMEESWKDHADYAFSIRNLLAEPYADAIAALADAVGVKGPAHRRLQSPALAARRRGGRGFPHPAGVRLPQAGRRRPGRADLPRAPGPRGRRAGDPLHGPGRPADGLSDVHRLAGSMAGRGSDDRRKERRDGKSLFQSRDRRQARPHRQPGRQALGPRAGRSRRPAGLRPIFL